MKPKSDTKPVVETMMKSETSNVTTSTSFENMLSINPSIVVNRVQFDTTIKFDSPEAVCQFFMRYIPLDADIHLTVMVAKP